MTIYVYCPEGKNPPPGGVIAGGAQMLYRFVDVLNKNGFDAYMLHQNRGFKCGWFEHETKIAYMPEVSMNTSDYLVLPESLGPKSADNARGVKKVIYNQNCFLTFNGCSFDNKVFDIPYLDDEVVAVMTVSEHSGEYLKYVFPDIPIHRIHYGIEPSTFPFVPFKEKKKLISFMPRKLIGDILQVVNILKFRGKLNNFELVVIDKMNQDEVAKILGESMIYLSSSSYEGFGLPPAEAMLCGCIVAGYHGFGGEEFFKPEFSYPAADADVMAFAKAVEEAIDHCENEPQMMEEKGRLASEFIRQNHSPQMEEKDIVRAWKEITSLS